MKRLVVYAVTAILVLSGCASKEPAATATPGPVAPGGVDSDATFKTVVIDVNGRKVTCVLWRIYTNSTAGAMSCDWLSAR